MTDPVPLPRVVEREINGVPMRWFERDSGRVFSILQGRYSQPERLPADDRVRRVLDIGAREGAFVRYAWARWPGCWVDCVEPDMLYRALLEFNRTPGMRVLDGVPGDGRPYDVIRWAVEPDEDGAFTDGHRPFVIFDYTLFPDEG